ncbi:hypothetical protein ACXX82_02480 [Glaciimonas sp. GNP009]
MHPDEKTLAKRLAANSDGKYTVEQVEEQMRGMSMTKDGQMEAGSPDTIIGTNLGDGTWMRVGTTAEGEPIFTQQIAADDAALRAYIVGNTNNNVVPSLITYAGNSEYTAPVTRNILPIPTAHCGAAAADCAAGIAPSLTSKQRHENNTQYADYFSQTGNNFSRVAAIATAAGNLEIAIPLKQPLVF